MGVTRTLATFVKETAFDGIPTQGISAAKDLILDTIGVALAAQKHAAGQITIRYLRNLGASPVSSVIGSGLKTSAADAAFCNGFLAHALEYEDSWPETIHPSSMVFSPALAVAEQFGLSGRELIEAYVLGLEVLAKIRTAAGNITHTRGWHGSSVYGALGAAVAASKALGLDVRQIRWALGIAASGAGGFIRQSGTMAKPYQQGNAARQGVLAAFLAREGLNSDEDMIEGPGGFMEVFHDEGQFVLSKIVERLGRPFHILSPGVSIRKYPCPMVFQGVIETLLDLMKSLGVSYGDVEEVSVATTAKIMEMYDVPRPRTGELAKFSLTFVLATALRYGRVKQDDFADDRVSSSEIQAAIQKIHLSSLRPSEIPKGADPARYQPGISLRLKDGREFARRLDYPRGRYDDPTPKSEYVIPKFRENAMAVLSPQDVERCIELVQRLEEIDRLESLTDLVRGRA